MADESRFYKNNDGDKIWWLTSEITGTWEFSFDKKKIYNMFRDYPWKLTKEQVQIFDAENPFWADFFRDRKEDERRA